MKFYWFAMFFMAITIINVGCNATGSMYYNNETAGDLLGRRIDIEKFRTVARDRTPVILIHGLWGAELRDKTQDYSRIWGDFSCYPPTAESKFAALALSPDKNSLISPLTATDILKKTEVNLLGMTFEIESYSRLIELLMAAGYVPEKVLLPENTHYSTLFVYHYDWRRSIDENAAGLAEFIEEKKKYLQRQFNNCPKHRNKEVRFDLLGHSMGGLIARYYVEYGTQKIGCSKDPLPYRNWYGAKNIRKLIMTATPNAGYADAFLELVDGVRFDTYAPRCPAGVLATFPSYYQLMPEVSAANVKFLPSGKTADIFNVRLWKQYQWGLLEDSAFNRRLLAKMFPGIPEKEQFAAAAEYVDKLLNQAARFKLLISRPIGLPPEPLRYYLFASAGMKTNSQIIINEEDGSIKTANAAPGDGKVTLRSAGFELSQNNNPLLCDNIYVLDGGHMGIMENSIFACNLALVLHSEF